MKAKIKITEGCISYSYLINDKEWVDLTDEESKDYNLELVDDVCEELINQAQEQYQLPTWITNYLWDGDDAACSQDTFIRLVKNNKHTIEKHLGKCEECGDYIYEWYLELEIKDDDRKR